MNLDQNQSSLHVMYIPVHPRIPNASRDFVLTFKQIILMVLSKGWSVAVTDFKKRTLKIITCILELQIVYCLLVFILGTMRESTFSTTKSIKVEEVTREQLKSKEISQSKSFFSYE